MNLSLPLTSLRSHLANEFSVLRTRALRDTLWAKLTRRHTELARFPEGTFQKGPNRKSVGLKDIPVSEIIGTLYRHSDFDHRFRPLKKNLLDRWVNIYLLQQREGWPPILVHKVGSHFYVEDGHHRVSVARALGMVFIQANVWEYPSPAKPANKCGRLECAERNPVKQYATAAD
jgi:hypothetical protein